MCGSQSGTFPDGLDVLKQCSSKRRGRRYAVLEGRKKKKVQSLKKICRAMFCPNKKQEVSEQCSNLRRCSLNNVPPKEEEEDFRFLKEGGRKGEF